MTPIADRYPSTNSDDVYSWLTDTLGESIIPGSENKSDRLFQVRNNGAKFLIRVDPPINTPCEPLSLAFLTSEGQDAVISDGIQVTGCYVKKDGLCVTYRLFKSEVKVTRTYNRKTFNEWCLARLDQLFKAKQLGRGDSTNREHYQVAADEEKSLYDWLSDALEKLCISSLSRPRLKTLILDHQNRLCRVTVNPDATKRLKGHVDIDIAFYTPGIEWKYLTKKKWICYHDCRIENGNLSFFFKFPGSKAVQISKITKERFKAWLCKQVQLHEERTTKKAPLIEERTSETVKLHEEITRGKSLREERNQIAVNKKKNDVQQVDTAKKSYYRNQITCLTCKDTWPRHYVMDSIRYNKALKFEENNGYYYLTINNRFTVRIKELTFVRSAPSGEVSLIRCYRCPPEIENAGELE
ncbi:MAG: hypothetical protein ACFFD4_17210 [Candidatus Odinarchaeota archaeon]